MTPDDLRVIYSGFHEYIIRLEAEYRDGETGTQARMFTILDVDGLKLSNLSKSDVEFGPYPHSCGIC